MRRRWVRPTVVVEGEYRQRLAGGLRYATLGPVWNRPVTECCFGSRKPTEYWGLPLHVNRATWETSARALPVLLAFAFLCGVLPVASVSFAFAPGGICASNASIIPGERVGTVALGISLAEARDALAGAQGPVRPPLSPTLTNLGFFEGPNDGLTIIANNDRIALITLRLTDALTKCHTLQGIHVGSTATDVQRVYGTPPSHRLQVVWVYNRVGLGFSLTPSSSDRPSIVHEMEIFRPGQFCEISALLAKTGWGSPCERFTPHP